MPRVSVLLPVRDGGPWLAPCLDSLAAQTLADHEVIAIDDGSRDGSGELLWRRAARDPRLRVVRTPARGLVAALNRALAEARAPIVARMDADDVSHPDRLALQVERLEADVSLSVLGCRVELTAAASGSTGAGMRAYVEWGNSLLEHEALERERFVESPIVHPSVAMRAEALRRLGGWRDFDGPEDYDLWLRGFDAGLRFAKLPQVLLAWRDSPTRLTRTNSRYAAARFLALKVEALARGPLAGRSAVVWGAGPIGKSWARALLAKGVATRAFAEVNQRKIGRELYGIPVRTVGEAATLREALHLGAVGQKGARERLRAEAARHGLRDGREFLAVA